MSKRPHDSDASVAAEGLIKRLKAAGNDDIRLREVVESRAGASAATELDPSSGASSASTNASKLEMLPKEVLLDILASLRRRDLDALELVNHTLGSLVAGMSSDAPRRVISLTFNEEGLVMLTCPSDGWKHLPITEMSQYLPRSIITKVTFKLVWEHTFDKEMFQALRPCRAHFAADAVCNIRLLSAFPAHILYRALTEVVICGTFVLANLDLFFRYRRFADEQSLPALPCLANCANLQIDAYHDEFFDANGAVEWLLGTHSAATNAKHLSIGDIQTMYWDDFLVPFIVAIEQQFIQATMPASFKVDLLFFVGNSPAPAVGTTREHGNALTNEQLKIEVDTGVRLPNGEPAFKTKVTVQRKPTA